MSALTGASPGRFCIGAALCGAALVLTACDQRGFSGVEAEWERRKSQQFYVVAASPEAAVISALGRELAIRPADGFWVSNFISLSKLCLTYLNI